MMNEEGVFPRLLELIQDKKVEDAALHRMLLDLLYEMSRIQRLRTQDLCRCCSPCVPEKASANATPVLIDDEFVTYLLQVIEGLSDDVNDPYHYPVIRVLVRYKRSAIWAISQC